MRVLKVRILQMCVILLLLPAMAAAYNGDVNLGDVNGGLEQLAVQQLSVQYDLGRALHVFSGYLQNGWQDLGTVTVPKDWKRVYLVIIPSSESSCRIYVKVNGYDVVEGRQLSSTITVDVTDYVQAGSAAKISVYSNSDYPRVKVLLCPPNPAFENIEETKEELKKTNRNLELLKYGLFGLGLVGLVAAVYVGTRR